MSGSFPVIEDMRCWRARRSGGAGAEQGKSGAIPALSRNCVAKGAPSARPIAKPGYLPTPGVLRSVARTGVGRRYFGGLATGDALPPSPLTGGFLLGVAGAQAASIAVASVRRVAFGAGEKRRRRWDKHDYGGAESRVWWGCCSWYCWWRAAEPWRRRPRRRWEIRQRRKPRVPPPVRAARLGRVQARRRARRDRGRLRRASGPRPLVRRLGHRGRGLRPARRSRRRAARSTRWPCGTMLGAA